MRSRSAIIALLVLAAIAGAEHRSHNRPSYRGDAAKKARLSAIARAELGAMFDEAKKRGQTGIKEQILQSLVMKKLVAKHKIARRWCEDLYPEIPSASW